MILNKKFLFYTPCIFKWCRNIDYSLFCNSEVLHVLGGTKPVLPPAFHPWSHLKTRFVRLEATKINFPTSSHG